MKVEMGERPLSSASMLNFTEEDVLGTMPEPLCTHGINRLDQKILFSVVNVPLSLSAVLGNALVMIALYEVTTLRPPYKLLLSCLASTDLCVGLTTQPLFTVLLWTQEHSTPCFVLKLIAHIMATIFGGVSLATLSAISIDRLVALLLGVRYRQVVTLRKVQICVTSFWFLGVAISILYFYHFLLPLVITAILMLLFIVSSTFCYSKIYCTLSKVKSDIYPGEPRRISVRCPQFTGRYRKTVSSTLCIQVSLVLCYLPYGTLVIVFAITGIQSPSLNFAWAVAVTLVFFNSTLNPFLYCWKNREVKQAVKEKISHMCFFTR